MRRALPPKLLDERSHRLIEALGITPAQLRRVKHIFDTLDVTGSGYVFVD